MKKVLLFAAAVICMLMLASCSHEHSFGEWETVKAPTCTKSGIEERSCDCGAKQSRNVVSLGHSTGDWIVEREAKCTRRGYEYKKCSVCEGIVEEKETITLGHANVVVDEAVAPTCTETGLTEGKHCSACGYIIVSQKPVDKAEHTFKQKAEEKFLKTDATCTNLAVYYESCSTCGEKGSKTFSYGTALKPHVYDMLDSDAKYLKSDATCTEKAVYYKSCACGKAGTETFEYGDTLPHTFDKLDTDAKYLKSDATCTNEAEYYKSCSACGEKGSETFFEVVPHTYIANIVAPKKFEDGYTEHVCGACGYSYRDSYVDATGSEGLAYTVNTDGTTCTVTGIGDCKDTEIAIPAKIDGYTVTAIGQNAFSERTELTFIKIAGTVKTIGTRAFYSCSGLTEITVPKSVSNIGTQIFYKCDNLKTVYYNGTYGSTGNPFLNTTSIEQVVFGGTSVPSYVCYECKNIEQIEITDSVTYIGWCAFEGCTGLTSIVIPDSVTSIGWDWYGSPFRGCTGLTSVTIGNGVTSIGDRAFRGCSGLTSVTIGNGVTSIGYYAFEACTSLKDLYIGDIEAWLKVNLYNSSSHPFCCPNSKERNLYINGEKVTEITIPDSVTSIKDYAFSGCKGLTSIVIPDSVMSIGDYAFCGCKGLASIVLPDSVTSIGAGAFRDCSGLTSITLGDGVTSIGNYAFDGCTGLTSITIPDSVTSIGESAFRGCTGLTSITIGDGVTSIGSSAFEGCTGLTSIVIPDSVTSIGGSAFKGCTDLTSITIPDSVTSIGGSAFYRCTGLTSIVIPDSVTSIGYYAFYYCINLNTVYYGGTESDWAKISISSDGDHWITDVTRYYYSETQPTESGNFWHYVNGVPTKW